MYWLLIENMRFHTDIIALQCWIQCSVGVGSVITTSVSNKRCTYIEFHSAGTLFPHRDAQTTEGLPLDSDDNRKKDWRIRRKHKWNWALTHPQLSMMVLFHTPVTVSLQAASAFSFRLSFLLFLHFVFWKTNTVNGNSNAVRPQFVSAESVGLWRNKWEISAPQPRLPREKHSLGLNAAYIQHRRCCFSVWKANKQNTFSFCALKWCCYLLSRDALFASWIRDKKRVNPDITQLIEGRCPIRYDLRNSMTDTVAHSK